MSIFINVSAFAGPVHAMNHLRIIDQKPVMYTSYISIVLTMLLCLPHGLITGSPEKEEGQWRPLEGAQGDSDDHTDYTSVMQGLFGASLS